MIHAVGMHRIRIFAAAFVASLTIACLWAVSAVAEPVLPAPTAQASATEQSEEAAEATEAQEEASEVSAEAAPAFQPRATREASTSASGKIARLTRKIHHLRVVKERIRARRRQLRQLPANSKRRQHGLEVQTAKLLRKRNRLFFLQKERGELEGH